MALKILTKKEKRNLSYSELRGYEEKLRQEVIRRSERFNENDKYFRQQSNKYKASLDTDDGSSKFPQRQASDFNQVNKGILTLEQTLQHKKSTVKGRKEIQDKSFASFNRNLQDEGGNPLSRTKYNRLSKFFDELDENTDLSEYFFDSESVVSAVTEGFKVDEIIETLSILDKINSKVESEYKLNNYSLDLLKEASLQHRKTGKDEDIEEIFKRYAGRTTFSNED